MNSTEQATGFTQHFFDSAALLQQCGSLLTDPAETAVQALLATLMGDGKVLACGNGATAPLADNLCAYLVSRLEAERMELAALSLCHNPALTCAETPEQMFARQIRALGKQNDMLWLFSALGEESSLCAAVTAAHERGLMVVAVTGGVGGAVVECLNEHDLLLNIPHRRPLHVIETQTVLLHAVCAQLDHLLLGSIYPNTEES